MSISMLAKAFLHVASHSKQLVHGGYGAIRLGLINPGPAVALRGGVMTRFKADDTAVGRKTITELTTMDHRVINKSVPYCKQLRLQYNMRQGCAMWLDVTDEVRFVAGTHLL